MRISVKDNIREFTRHLDDIQRRQIPFATSRALNDTAIAAQESIQAAIQTRFNNRKTWWKKNQPTGIKVKFSKKTDLVAEVFTHAHFAQLQEKGGTKTPRGTYLTIPTPQTPKKFYKSTGAREYMQSNRRTFSIKGKGIFRRRSKKTIIPVFTYARAAQVRPRFGFEMTAEATANAQFKRFFEARLAQAIASAK